jgi:hypothetical protein
MMATIVLAFHDAFLAQRGRALYTSYAVRRSRGSPLVRSFLHLSRFSRLLFQKRARYNLIFHSHDVRVRSVELIRRPFLKVLADGDSPQYRGSIGEN